MFSVTSKPIPLFKNLSKRPAEGLMEQQYSSKIGKTFTFEIQQQKKCKKWMQ